MSLGITTTVDYKVEYEYYSCFDDGGIGHDTTIHTGRRPIDAENDREARLAADDINQELHNGGKDCYCHPDTSRVTKIFKTTHECTEDGFERTTIEKLGLPERLECPCGKVYTPMRGETACHKLVEV